MAVNSLREQMVPVRVAEPDGRQHSLKAARRREINLVLFWHSDRWGQSVTNC
jgi:hypothetical protein